MPAVQGDLLEYGHEMQAGDRQAVTDFREILLQRHPEMRFAWTAIVQRSDRPDGRAGRAERAADSSGDLSIGCFNCSLKKRKDEGRKVPCRQKDQLAKGCILLPNAAGPLGCIRGIE